METRDKKTLAQSRQQKRYYNDKTNDDNGKAEKGKTKLDRSIQRDQRRMASIAKNALENAGLKFGNVICTSNVGLTQLFVSGKFSPTDVAMIRSLLTINGDISTTVDVKDNLITFKYET